MIPKGIIKPLLGVFIFTWMLSLQLKAQFTNGDFSLGVNGCNAGTGWTTNVGPMSAQRTETYQVGDPWVDLTHCNGWGNGTFIEQAVPVVVGACYRIDFDLSSHCGWDGSRAGVYITIDGVALGGWISVDTIRCPPPLYWERKSSLTFVAQNNPTVVRFTGEGRCRDFRTGTYPCSGPGAIGNPGVIALDNVELVPVTGQALIVNLGNDTVYCDTFTRTLDAGNFGAGATYQWNTGAISQSISVNSPGTYSVVVNTMCGSAGDTITIGQGIMPNANLGADTVTCSGIPLNLQPKSPAPTNVKYTWNTGESTRNIQVTQPGNYWLEMDINGCIHRDTIEVTIIDIELDLGDDISICDTDTPLVLNSPFSSAYHHVWSNGLSDTFMRVQRSGVHWLEVSMGACRNSDTIYVDLVPSPNYFIGVDTTICTQFPHRIGMDLPGATYVWSTGDTTSHIIVDQTGTYISEVSLRGCTVADTIDIIAKPVPPIDLGGDRDICPEQVIVLSGAYEFGSTYEWTTGATSSEIAVTEPGTYGVRVTSPYHCIGGDTVKLLYYPLPSISLSDDTSVCEETPVMLMAKVQYTDSIIWSNGMVGNIISVKYGGIYTATAFNKCGTDVDTVKLNEIFCDIWVPNVFTPNGDGLNDIFRALGNLGRVQDFGLSIYNRWGERVYHTNDKFSGWDGAYHSGEADLGTYLYLLEYSFEGTPYQLKGSFHLIR